LLKSRTRSGWRRNGHVKFKTTYNSSKPGPPDGASAEREQAGRRGGRVDVGEACLAEARLPLKARKRRKLRGSASARWDRKNVPGMTLVRTEVEGRGRGR